VRLGYVNALAGTAQAVGLSGGIAGENDILHPRKRFYAGGSQSVRGFPESQLGPRVLTIPAAKLLQIDTTAACTPATITQCNPDLGSNDRDFDPRPLGGNLLAEGSVEFRFPLFANFIGATFVDMGFLSQNTNAALPKSKAAITPGFGVRYLSPVGPIRVDVGINPVLREKLPVVTEDIANGGEGLVTLTTRRTYSPAGSGRGLNQILSRLTLHLSIGEAF
jgi:outer membrane protein assembly factor BamA